jgi:YggT family protein
MLPDLIRTIANIYIVLIIVRAVLSWFNTDPYHPANRALMSITEPLLGPIRRIIPMTGVDFSPLIAILLIQLVVRLVAY